MQLQNSLKSFITTYFVKFGSNSMKVGNFINQKRDNKWRHDIFFILKPKNSMNLIYKCVPGPWTFFKKMYWTLI